MSSRVRNTIAVAGRLLRTRRAAPGAVVLGYHDVVASPDGDPWSVTVDDFRSHLDVLTRLGLAIVPLATIVKRLTTGRPVDGLAAVTFDDALAGVDELALPILRELGAPATIFVVSDHCGVDPPWWPGAARTMTPGELRAAAADGLELASHTRSHRSLIALGDDELEDELAGSRARVSELSGRSVDLLAYPSGHHDARVREAARRCGFAAACTFLNGRITGDEDPLRLPRLTMGAHMSARRLAFQLRRPPASWPDHQLDAVEAHA